MNLCWKESYVNAKWKKTLFVRDYSFIENDGINIRGKSLIG